MPWAYNERHLLRFIKIYVAFYAKIKYSWMILVNNRSWQYIIEILEQHLAEVLIKTGVEKPAAQAQTNSCLTDVLIRGDLMHNIKEMNNYISKIN